MFCVTSQQGTDFKKNVYLSIVHNFLSFIQLWMTPVSMGRLQVTSARDAEHFWWLRMFHYLFVISFPQGRRWWVWTIHYIWKQSTILGSVMQNKSRKKTKRIHGRGSRAGAKAKLQQKPWKSLLIEHKELPCSQMCCSQFPHPWTDTRWCCRGDSHICSPCTNVCLRGQRPLSLVAASGHLSFAVPKSQVTPQPYLTHWPRWAGVREGSLWVLCRATTISFCQSHFKARFSQVHVSSSEDPVE